MKIEYGFDAVGGFIAVSRKEKVAYYAYPTSEHAKVMRSKPRLTKLLPDIMREEIKFNKKHQAPERYAHILSNLLALPAVSRGSIVIE